MRKDKSNTMTVFEKCDNPNLPACKGVFKRIGETMTFFYPGKWFELLECTCCKYQKLGQEVIDNVK